MGNTESQGDNSEYDDYITQQKRIIMAQQEQIERLSRLNLRSNIIQSQSQPQPQPQPQPQSQSQPQPQPNLDNRTNISIEYKDPKEKLNPYTILNISKNYDETSLKKAYIKKAMVTHPDKGGDPNKFKKVSIAYAVLLKKLKEKDSDALHDDLKNGSREYIQSQNETSLKNVKLTEKFDAELFNKIYEENRIDDVYDSGYGKWMEENKVNGEGPKKMFNGNFNKNMFNREFENYKKEQQERLGSNLVKYQEPEVDISYKNKDSIMVLGKGKIENFSGESGGLNYTDYKDAYTNSCLIDTKTVSIRKRTKSVLDKEAERKNISYQMTEKDMKLQELKRIKGEKEENERIMRLKQFEERAFNNYNEVHKRLLGR
jgi:curved DNA-binding protein CbpA